MKSPPLPSWLLVDGALDGASVRTPTVGDNVSKSPSGGYEVGVAVEDVGPNVNGGRVVLDIGGNVATVEGGISIVGDVVGTSVAPPSRFVIVGALDGVAVNW